MLEVEGADKLLRVMLEVEGAQQQQQQQQQQPLASTHHTTAMETSSQFAQLVGAVARGGWLAG